ncbi:hypothetical protein DPMN_072165 [Dreissena polymorpha]|uniref:VWFA domain-containing protein n=2 Tax=Dreissena polymorpha TaxID=45954 RepID=A0A9D3Z3K5_DREPO|nr:hypothetical protein DPMN_072165 [Dreissena polymorpha]
MKMKKSSQKKRSLDDSQSDASSTSSYLLVTGKTQSEHNDDSSYYTQSFESNMTDQDEEGPDDEAAKTVGSPATYEDLREEIMNIFKNGCKFIIGIDYTVSNTTQGSSSFGGKCLHDVLSVNPYQKVITCLGETIESLIGNEDVIHAFGFGDSKVRNKDVFPLNPDKQCRTYLDVYDSYNTITNRIRFGNPTDFSPIINKALDIVNETNEFHVLLIISDCQVSEVKRTKDALIRASQYALSIVVIGIGDGPWTLMEQMEATGNRDEKMSNFNFVNYNHIVSKAANPDIEVAEAILQNMKSQRRFLHDMGYLED